MRGAKGTTPRYFECDGRHDAFREREPQTAIEVVERDEADGEAIRVDRTCILQDRRRLQLALKHAV